MRRRVQEEKIISSTIQLDGVGPILLERSNRARRLVLSVRRDRGVRVAVPRGVSFRNAERFAMTRIGWIRRQLDVADMTERECLPFLQKLEAIDRSYARRRLVDRLAELAGRHGFSYNRVSIRNQRTRWGSCSHQNNISLNFKLAAFSQDLMDYVILHELVHTRISHHGPEFWRELARFVPDVKDRASKVRKYGLVML